MLRRTALTLLLATSCAICLALVLNRNTTRAAASGGGLMAGVDVGLSRR